MLDTSSFFICGDDAVSIKLSSMKQLNISEDGLICYYENEEGNETWALKNYEGEDYNIDIPVLKRLPDPPIEVLIDIAVESEDMKNVRGASLELFDREINNEEAFRLSLIERLERFVQTNINDFDKGKISLIIYESNLYDATNRRKIVGKHYTEILEDAKYYRNIAERANVLSENY